MKTHPGLAEHPIKRVPNWTDSTVALSFHGDGVPVSGKAKGWQKSADVYSFSSMLGTGSTINIKYVYIYTHIYTHIYIYHKQT